MEIETDRLFVKLLTLPQLRLWVNEISTLEKELNCKYDAEPMEGIFLDIVKAQIKIIENDTENYMYYSFWFIIRKTDRKVIGSMDFKNIPNETKEVEIGYGLGKNYEHKGYMTEAVMAFCKWAVSQENINQIIAETEIENLPSQNVLKRCGFVKYKQENTLWWRF